MSRNIYHLPDFLLDFFLVRRYGLRTSEFHVFGVFLGMYVNELSVRESLTRMVRRITSHLALRDDLMQEAMIHMWLTEARRPGQTRSWYLQSCKYHLLHYLASGRSVDSGKRRSGRILEEEIEEGLEKNGEAGDCGNSVVTWVSARDIISMLSPRLTLLERTVLDCFADGLGPRDIGRKLGISHTMVIKHRKKIASIFERLELYGPGKSSEAAASPTHKKSNNGFGLSQTRRNSRHLDGFMEVEARLNGFGLDSGRARNAWRQAIRRARIV